MTLLQSGEPTVWGLDVDTHHLHLAIVGETGAFQTNAAELPRSADHGRNLSEVHGAAIRFLGAVADHFPPAFVYVELPTGLHASPRLMMTAGVFCMAAHAVTPDAGVYLIPPGKWKKGIGLKGNASKHDVFEWARSIGYTGTGQDQADALGIASYLAHVTPGWQPPAPTLAL